MEYKVYDKVWYMEDNVPVERMIFAVIVSMDSANKWEETYLQLVPKRLGSGWAPNIGTHLKAVHVFPDKASLVKSLIHKGDRE